MNRRRFLQLAGLSVLAAGTWAAPWPGRPKVPARATATTCPPTDERGLRLIAVGDIMAHLPVTQSARQPDGSYDFRPHLKYVRPIFQDYDLALGNLETPLAGGAPSGYPMFNAPDDLADSLKWAGFSALTLANNHSLDRGWPGLARTAEQVRARGFHYVGAYLSAADRAEPRLVSAGGVRAGLLGYTYGVNGPLSYPGGETWRLNVIDRELILADMAALKGAGADFIVINLHFGHEYHRTPHKTQIALVEALFQGGADLIIGHHPHVVQPGILRPGPEGGGAVFSLGNFLSNQRDRYTDQGLMVGATLGFDRLGRKTLGTITLRQTRCLRRVINGRPTYRVLPVHEALANPPAYALTEAEAAVLSRDRLAMSKHLVDY
jgi:poly-gamma-glutamate synthesis protein (capsule biosynthesis protein)